VVALPRDEAVQAVGEEDRNRFREGNVVSKRRWCWVQFENAKSHFVCAGLLRDLLAEMKDRGVLFQSVMMDTDCVTFDMPGMIVGARPWESFDFFGLTLEIPCEDVATFITQLRGLELRRFARSVAYYKLHGLHRCMVLTPPQRDALQSMLMKRVMLAEQRAHAFYAGQQPVSEILREANAKATGRSVDEVPDLGGHKNDRFHGKTRGEA
jgi:hypothetical protein